MDPQKVVDAQNIIKVGSLRQIRMAIVGLAPTVEVGGLLDLHRREIHQ